MDILIKCILIKKKACILTNLFINKIYLIIVYTISNVIYLIIYLFIFIFIKFLFIFAKLGQFKPHTNKLSESEDNIILKMQSYRKRTPMILIYS